MPVSNDIIRPLILALAASLVLPSGAVLAADAHSDAETAEAVPVDSLVVELAVGDNTASVTMPCTQTQSGPPGGESFESRVCFDGDQLFVFAIAQGDDGVKPMFPNFDAAYEEVKTSHDTLSVEVEEVNGRRTMRAVRGPDPAYGGMQAIEMRDDAVVYAISMSRPGRQDPMSDAQKLRMDAFVNSLEIAE